MNLKSYARGIGAGLMVSALVLGIGNKPAKMTDDQIRKRAEELGMIQSQTLTQVSSETSVSVSIDKTKDIEEVKEDVSENAEAETLPEVVTSEEGVIPELKEPDKETVEPILPEKEEEPEAEEEKIPPVINPMPEEESGYTTGENSVSIQVVRGDSSVSVARRMFEAGLVDSAVEFDKFLCENGYDKVISVGTYEIPFGISFDEMARIITRR